MTGQTRPAHLGWCHRWWVRCRSGWRGWWAGDEGQVSAFVVTLVVAILALAGLTLDGGLALVVKVRANGQAQAAARAGAQALDLGAYRATGAIQLIPAQATANARRYLAAVRATGAVTVTGDTVTVTVTATQPTQLLGLVGIRALTVHGSASAHPVRGVLTVEP
ncbi:MAG: pilus assembly protein TadG-related protein [Pseudonocardiaceae bacterium]